LQGIIGTAVVIAAEELKPSQLTPKLEQLIETTRQQQAQQQAEAAQKSAITDSLAVVY